MFFSVWGRITRHRALLNKETALLLSSDNGQTAFHVHCDFFHHMHKAVFNILSTNSTSDSNVLCNNEAKLGILAMTASQLLDTLGCSLETVLAAKRCGPTRMPLNGPWTKLLEKKKGRTEIDSDPSFFSPHEPLHSPSVGQGPIWRIPVERPSYKDVHRRHIDQYKPGAFYPEPQIISLAQVLQQTRGSCREGPSRQKEPPEHPRQNKVPRLYKRGSEERQGGGENP